MTTACDLRTVKLRELVTSGHACVVDEELPWEFGRMLTAAIDRSGKSRRELARLAGISAPLITNLEAGMRSAGPGIRVPVRTTPDTVVRIAVVLQMPLRRSLEAAGLGDSIPPDMTDEEIQNRFRPAIDDMLDALDVDVLLAAIQRRVRSSEGGEAPST